MINLNIPPFYPLTNIIHPSFMYYHPQPQV